MHPSWLGRAVRNRHRHAIEQASRRWRTRRKLLMSTQVVPRAYGGSSTWENTVCACTACNAKKACLLPSQLKAVGMRLPNPRAPSAYELEAAARGLAVHNLLRKKNVHESWKIHIGAADLNATMAKVARENEGLFATDVEPRKLVKRDRSVAYSR